MEPQNNFPPNLNQPNVPPTAPISETTFPMPPKKSRIGLVLSITGVLIVIVIGIFYFFFYKLQPVCWPYCPSMTDEDRENIKESITQDWKTYRNGNVGFTFSYPTNWEEGTFGRDDEFINILNGQNQIEARLLGPFKCKCTDKELEQILVSDVIYDGSGKHPQSINEFTKITIANNQFYKIRTSRFEGTLSYNYYLPKDNRVLVLSFTSQGVAWTDPNLDEESDSTHVVLKQILSTFKFTK